MGGHRAIAGSRLLQFLFSLICNLREKEGGERERGRGEREREGREREGGREREREREGER